LSLENSWLKYKIKNTYPLNLEYFFILFFVGCKGGPSLSLFDTLMGEQEGVWELDVPIVVDHLRW
jgi:hypothetical protein